jgi:threonine dehydrogenase-like Zn-dependent dehydrogenase
MFSVAVIEPGKVQLVKIPTPEPGPYEVRIHNEVACLCNATDRKLVDGHFPGYHKYPLLLGHETAGIVDKKGSKVRNFKIGDRVVDALLLTPTDPVYESGWGGFSEYVIAGDHKAMLEDGVATPEYNWYEDYEIMLVVPPSIPVEAAVLLCTWREVYGAFGDFNLQPGQDILIFGAGPVGLSFTKFASLFGLNYIGVVEFLEGKRKKSLEMGATESFSPDDPALLDLVQRRGKPLDAVIDAVGKESIINAALPLIKMAGSVCVYGVIDQPSIQLNKTNGPYNFNLQIHQWPTRFRESAAHEPLIQWLLDGKLDPNEFLSAEFPIQEINKALELSRTGQTLKTLLRF